MARIQLKKDILEKTRERSNLTPEELSRVEALLDHAVLSRVMLKLRNPDLDWKSRAVVWRTMLQSAGLTLLEGTFDELAEPVLNGRQIRNLTRLAKILHPTSEVTLGDMRAVLQFGSTQSG
ncbi:MAG: hypothetical protein L0215_02880 [Gemmataceae bacterium]|nr:hypothetical protein [Gemmataceae bacterium]